MSNEAHRATQSFDCPLWYEQEWPQQACQYCVFHQTKHGVNFPLTHQPPQSCCVCVVRRETWQDPVQRDASNFALQQSVTVAGILTVTRLRAPHVLSGCTC